MSHRTVVVMAFAGVGTALVSAVAWWGHLVMLAGWSLLGLWAIRNASGPREVLHDDVRTARCANGAQPA